MTRKHKFSPRPGAYEWRPIPDDEHTGASPMTRRLSSSRGPHIIDKPEGSEWAAQQDPRQTDAILYDLPNLIYLWWLATKLQRKGAEDDLRVMVEKAYDCRMIELHAILSDDAGPLDHHSFLRKFIIPILEEATQAGDTYGIDTLSCLFNLVEAQDDFRVIDETGEVRGDWRKGVSGFVYRFVPREKF